MVQFTLSGRLVRTTAATEFKKTSCQDLSAGTTVKVKGIVQSDGSMVATKVERTGDNDDDDLQGN